MNDQAQLLRGLMEQRGEPAATLPLPGSRRRAHTVAVASGKGGAGKSNIALNLAIRLAQTDHKVCLLDANMGLGNLDLLCGLNGYWNLAHVISGARDLSEIMLSGPAQVHVIPGASGLIDVADCPPSAQREILAQLETIEYSHDFLIIDTGTGIHKTVRQFVSAADTILVLTTPEPTSIADAYAMIKALGNSRESARPMILVNQADSIEQARGIILRMQETARTFLHTTVDSAGSIPRDPQVPRAVHRRVPFVMESPHCPAAQGIEQLARRVINLSQRSRQPQTYFSQFREILPRAA
jgi:flagellar biosynthesis protein FlhG